MKEKKTKIVLVVLVIITVLLSWQLNNANKMNVSKENQLASILFKSMAGLSKGLYSISETLDLYEEGFTPDERILFENSLESEMKLLNELGHNLFYLTVGDFHWGTEVYDNYILGIELLLNDIKNKKVDDEESIKVISSTIKQGSEELIEIFFYDPVGIDGLYDDEVQERIMGALETINKGISGLDIDRE